MTDQTQQKNPHRPPKFKQCVHYEDSLINLLAVTSFKYFYSGTHHKWYLGYYGNTGNWTTIDSSFDEDVIKEKFNTIKKELCE